MPISRECDRVGEEKLQHSARSGTLAIDLGSTTTVVAFQAEDADRAQLLDLPPISRRSGEVPSLVWTRAGDAPLVGQQVIESGLADLQDPRLATDFKRAIGSETGNRDAENAGEQLLQQIWSHLPEQGRLRRLVLTAPVERYRSYRQWLLQACERLPVEEIALVDEPTAAALGAGLPAGARLLVVDLGGSTLDLALVALEGGEGKAAPIAQLLRLQGRSLGDASCQKLRTARVLGKAGLRLGGRDIDRWIVGRCYPDLKPSQAALNAAERLKCRLSDRELPENQVLSESFTNSPEEVERMMQLSRRSLDELLQDQGLDEALAQLLETTMTGGRQHGCDLDGLQGVVAVGGGAQMPWLRRWLALHTQPAPLLTPPPVEAVALGALQLTPGVSVRDVLNNGVSLRVWDQRSHRHRWHPLFVAGQPWPSSAPLELRIAASRPEQTELELVLGEPSADGRHDVVFIDGMPTLRRRDAGETTHQTWEDPELVLPLDPPGDIGEDCLKLELRIDSDAQLIVEITDLRTGLTLPSRRLGTVR